MILEDHVGFIMTKALRNLNLLFNQEFNRYGITSEQWSLLKRLDDQEGVSIKDLAQGVGKDQGNVTRILDLLEKRGFVKRCSNPNDKRSSLIYFTNAGKELTERLMPIDEKVHQIAVDGLSKNEFALFTRVLSQIDKNTCKFLIR
ncbi:MarR family winged helix-turn-helix transcriptional regulator [Gorillibacterium massiliense]|uniref:MarR family winged helix-turn-helix transcriptional regulator n=1 Tax=Gorillibacterium massiliense TaxID=1280390 RepID=UPI000693844C|nr:MarR family transcriptional regulator [Gorillibacterium massiliense]